MAFMTKDIIDLKGILLSMLLIIPSIAATNIDCNGKAFRCVNSTHFMICVDLGTGTSTTIDDFVMRCPLTTACRPTNRFECEFPSPVTVTTEATITEITTVTDKVSGTDVATLSPGVAVSVSFEEYLNTISVTTVSEFDLSSDTTEIGNDLDVSTDSTKLTQTTTVDASDAYYKSNVENSSIVIPYQVTDIHDQELTTTMSNFPPEKDITDKPILYESTGNESHSDNSLLATDKIVTEELFADGFRNNPEITTTNYIIPEVVSPIQDGFVTKGSLEIRNTSNVSKSDDLLMGGDTNETNSYKDAKLNIEPMGDITTTVMMDTTITVLNPNSDLVNKSTTVLTPSAPTESSVLSTESNGNTSQSDNSLIATEKIVTEELFADGFSNNSEITTTKYIIPEVVSPKQDGFVTIGSLEIRNTTNVSNSDDLLMGGDTNETKSYRDAQLNQEPMGDITTTVMLETTITVLKPNSNLVNESTTILTPSAPTESSVLSTESNGNTSQSDTSLISMEQTVTEELFTDVFQPESTTINYFPEFISPKEDGFVTIESPVEIINITNVSKSDDPPVSVNNINTDSSYKDAQLKLKPTVDTTTTVMSETTITLLEPNSDLVSEATTFAAPSVTESSILSTISKGNESPRDNSLIKMEETVTEESFITDAFHNNPESTTTNYVPEFIPPKQDGFVTIESPVEIINITNVSKSDDPPVSSSTIDTDRSYKDAQLNLKQTGDTTTTVTLDTTITVLEPNSDLVHETTTLLTPSVTTESSILTTIISNGNKSPNDNNLIKMEETATEESFTDAFRNNPESTTTNHVPDFILPKQDGFVTLESPVEIINITNVSKSDDPPVSGNTINADSNYKDAHLNRKPTVDTTTTVMSETTNTVLEPNSDLVSEATTVAGPNVTESSILSTISNTNEIPRDNSLINMEETVTEESFTDALPNNPENTTNNNNVPEFILPKQDGFVTIESPVEIINITNVSKSDDPPVSSSTINTESSYKDAQLNLKQTGDTTTTVMSETTITVLEPNNNLVSEATTVAAPSVTESSILSTISNGNESQRDNSLIKMEQTVTEESFITEAFHNNPENTTTNYVAEFILPKQDGFVTIESPVEIINITNVLKSDDPPVSGNTIETGSSYKDVQLNLKPTGDTTTTVMLDTTIDVLGSNTDLVYKTTTVLTPSVSIESPIISTDSNDWAAVTSRFTEGSPVIYNKKPGSTGVIQETSTLSTNTGDINDLDNNHTLKTNISLGFIMNNDDNVPFLTNDKHLETVTTSYVEMTTATILSEGNYMEHVTISAEIDVVTSDIHTSTKNEIITAKLNTQKVTDTTTSPNTISNIGLNTSEAYKIMFVATSAYSELITKEEDEMFITDTPRILVTSTESAKTEELSTEENLTFAQTETTENSNSGNKIMEHKTPVKDLETLTNSYSVTTNNLEMATESSVREQGIDGQNIYTIINEKSSTHVPILNEKVLSTDDLNRNVETQTYTETLSSTTDSHVFSTEVEITSPKTSEAPVLITTDLYLVQEPQHKEKERETKTLISLEDLSTLGDRSTTNTATISVKDIELNNESSLIDIQLVTSDPQSTSLDINIFKTTNNFPVESETITKDSISEELDIISKNIVNESSATQVINVVDKITTPAPLVSIIHKNVDEEKADLEYDTITHQDASGVQRSTLTLVRKDDDNLQATTQSMYRAGNNNTIVKDERNIIPTESSPPIEKDTRVDISSDLIIQRASTLSILDLTTGIIDPGTNAAKINILNVTTPKLQVTNGELYDKVPELETQSIEISTRDYSQITTPPVYTIEQNQFAIVKNSSDNLYLKVQSTERSDVTISESSTSLDNLSLKVLNEAVAPEITTDKHYNPDIAPIYTNKNRSLVTDKETNPKINSESEPYKTDHDIPTKENSASTKNTIAVNESDPTAVTEQYIRTQTDIWNDTISDINKQYTESIVTSSESSSPSLVNGGINVKSTKDKVQKNPNGASLDLTVTTDDTADIIIENIPVKQTHSGTIALKAETLNDHNRKTQEEGEVEGLPISTHNEKEINNGEKEEQMTLSQNANFDRISKSNIANSQVEKPSTHELIEDSPTTESYSTNNRPKDQNKKDNDQSRAESLPSTNSNVGIEQTSDFLVLQSTTPKPNPSLYDCTHKRGRHADTQDCRKFYVCLGNGHIIVGTCPVNTVFSEIRKQCTNNLSHCIINNQFQCLTEGHFIDYFNDSMYYICVKNGSSFIRFKLQCLNGYHLDKTIVRCSLNTESDQSDSNSDSNSTRNSKSDSNRTSNSKSETSESSPSVQEENVKSEKQFKCEKSGKFPDVSNPRRYFECTKKDGKYRQKKKKCRDDKIFDVVKKSCICIDSDASNESR